MSDRTLPAESPVIVVLAAGMGSRFGGSKQTTAVGANGESLLEYSVFDALEAGFRKVVFIVRSDFEQDFRQAVANRLPDTIEVHCVCQDTARISDQPADGRLWGTGHALLGAQPLLTDNFAVINADDYYGRDAYDVAFKLLTQRGGSGANSFFNIAYPLRETLSPSGPVSRAVCETADGTLTGIQEHTRLQREGDRVRSFGPEAGDTTIATT